MITYRITREVIIHHRGQRSGDYIVSKNSRIIGILPTLVEAWERLNSSRLHDNTLALIHVYVDVTIKNGETP